MIRSVLVLSMGLLISGAGIAAGIPGNEAVQMLSAGIRRVELPPGPRNGSRPRPVTEAFAPGVMWPTFVIETDAGLRECPYQWIDSSCRNYQPGRDKRMRAWVLKLGGRWQVCSRPGVNCVGYYEPHYPLLQP